MTGGAQRGECYTPGAPMTLPPTRALLLGLATLTLASAALAGFTLTKTAPAVQFTGVGPGGFKMVGKTAALSLVQDDKALTVVVALADLTTGIALRDKHMREKYLEVPKFPDTRLTVPLAALPSPAAGAAVDVELKGQLTLHGVQREVPVKVRASCTPQDVCTAKGTFTINIKDFGVVVPTYLGVTLKPDVTVEATFEATR